MLQPLSLCMPSNRGAVNEHMCLAEVVHSYLSAQAYAKQCTAGWGTCLLDDAIGIPSAGASKWLSTVPKHL